MQKQKEELIRLIQLSLNKMQWVMSELELIRSQLDELKNVGK
jgi:hypothetical protein